MTRTVHVNLSEGAYRRIKRWAEAHQQDIGEAIAAYLAENLPDGEGVPPSATDHDLEREKAAYLGLHPQLQDQYAGQYVAIHDGQLVDHDTDYGALFERVDDRFPDRFVWMTRVEDQPVRTIVVRSPRFARDAA
jgi:hypothetical protein